MRFARISYHGVAQFTHSTGGNFGDRSSINGPLVCECNRLDEHGLNLLELRFLFGSEVIPIGPGREENRRSARESQSW